MPKSPNSLGSYEKLFYPRARDPLLRGITPPPDQEIHLGSRTVKQSLLPTPGRWQRFTEAARAVLHAIDRHPWRVRAGLGATAIAAGISVAFFSAQPNTPEESRAAAPHNSASAMPTATAPITRAPHNSAPTKSRAPLARQAKMSSVVDVFNKPLSKNSDVPSKNYPSAENFTTVPCTPQASPSATEILGTPTAQASPSSTMPAETTPSGSAAEPSSSESTPADSPASNEPTLNAQPETTPTSLPPSPGG